ncbi:MAG TPA: sterol desaturase family protein [Thermoanaerobaculia bacterium]
MGGSVLRAAAFLAGLLGLRAAEVLEPHHPPTAPLARRWVANLGLGLVNGLVVSALCAACFLLAAQGRLPAAVAPLPRLVSSPWIQAAVAVVLLDLVTYALHWAFHRVPLLWRFHAVHHTDLDLDVSSASRFHTGEVLFSSAAKLGFVTLLGIPPVGLVVFEIVMLASAQFQHANVRIAAGVESVLWVTLVPPAMHRIHHAPNRRDTDSNYGTILTLWDRLFGTFNRRAADERPAFGIPGMRDPERLGLGSLTLLPFRRAPGT